MMMANVEAERGGEGGEVGGVEEAKAEGGREKGLAPVLY